ncbi:MAG: divalent-cation tolerance protein CutA [Polyangiaceae bacterium]|nr:divalent-cation tolerance protein CutA [Polyangiaceae bacterium]
MALRIVYVTHESEEQALALGRQLVEERLAACVNVLPGMRSCYRWEGAIEEGREAVLLVKTREDLADAVVRRVAELHGYSVPCALVLPIEGGHAPYLEWLARETG